MISSITNNRTKTPKVEFRTCALHLNIPCRNLGELYFLVRAKRDISILYIVPAQRILPPSALAPHQSAFLVFRDHEQTELVLIETAKSLSVQEYKNRRRLTRYCTAANFTLTVISSWKEESRAELANLLFVNEFADLPISQNCLALVRQTFNGRVFSTIGEMQLILREAGFPSDLVFALIQRQILFADLREPDVTDSYTAVFSGLLMHVDGNEQADQV